MKVSPKKPHFFKPILPGFKHGIKIPIGFLKYLKGRENIEHAILRCAGKKWQVKVNGRRLEEGWEKFVEEHDLQYGDMLVFRYEGNMEFEVSIFHSNQCEREYEEEQEAHNVEETSNKFEFKGIDSHKPFSQTHFVRTVKPYCLSKDMLSIPKKFAWANGLSNKKCDLIIRDERQRSWNLILRSYSTNVYISGGWNEIRDTHCLKEGDHIMFEVVANEKKPTWKFHDITHMYFLLSGFIPMVSLQEMREFNNQMRAYDVDPGENWSEGTKIGTIASNQWKTPLARALARP
ncbi:PREDICTED: B3 domain-containing protein REM5-like [Nicotiana attenuata]|uniref:B3 domain-containing protein REM5-like n=1 Tax=Nicotiana attenuata TaxID=49451 RepID=UPI000904DF29|nr:PREDICTED: B3 domain-containing protein REM5-like [Nicotiana attenuata]